MNEVELPPDQKETPAKISGPKRLRRLKSHELVGAGDFIPDGNEGFEPWEGPSGFRADAFVKPIYRAVRRRPTAMAI
jgi:hypothetical protein